MWPLLQTNKQTRNNFNYEVCKKNFSQAFQTFKEMKMIKEDSNIIIMLENTMKETFSNIEAEID